MDKKKKRILFAGAYGIENAGDDLPLIMMCEQLKKIEPGIDFEFHVLSRHPNTWEDVTYGIKTIKNLEYESKEEAEGKWFKGLNYGDDKTQLLQIVDEIKQSDLLVFGAGNFLIDISIDIFRGPIPLLALYIFLAKLYHKPVMLYGISAGPLRTELGLELSRWIVESSDIVTVRDEHSEKLLNDLIINSSKKIYVLPDATIAATPPDPEKIDNLLLENGITSSDKKRVAVALRDLSVVMHKSAANDAWDQLAMCFNKLKDDCEFIFIPQSTYKEDDDRITAVRFIEKLDKDVTYYEINRRYDPRELIGLYSACDATFSIRLHGAVFSAIAGTPMIAINYLPKVEGFMKGIGLENYLININAIQSDRMLKLFDNLFKNRDNLSNKIRKKINAKKNDVLMYAKLANSLLFKVM